MYLKWPILAKTGKIGTGKNPKPWFFLLSAHSVFQPIKFVSGFQKLLETFFSISWHLLVNFKVCFKPRRKKSGFWIFTTPILPVSVKFGHKSINLKLNRSFCKVYSWWKIAQCARLRTLLLHTLIYQEKTLCQFTYLGS